MSWDAHYDVLVVGSGAAALAAAATAAAGGQSTLLVEKTKYWGGTTAYSGGGVWIPANPLMVADGVDDSIEAGLAYLESIVGDVGPVSSLARRLAFLRNGPEMIRFLAAEGVCWTRTARYPDYYPDRPGGRIGRQLEPAVFDGRQLGPMLASSDGRQARHRWWYASTISIGSCLLSGPWPVSLAEQGCWRAPPPGNYGERCRSPLGRAFWPS